MSVNLAESALEVSQSGRCVALFARISRGSTYNQIALAPSYTGRESQTIPNQSITRGRVRLRARRHFQTRCPQGPVRASKPRQLVYQPKALPATLSFKYTPEIEPASELFPFQATPNESSSTIATSQQSIYNQSHIEGHVRSCR